MRFQSASCFRIVFIGVALGALVGCDRLHVPLLQHESPPPPRAPLSIGFMFDETLAEATLEQRVCSDQVWVGPLGQALMKAFVSAGQKRFAEATLVPPEGSPKPAADTSPDIIVHPRLLHRSMDAVSRMGDNNYFNARVAVELAVNYTDGTGRPIVEAPLRHSDEYSIWTPLLGSGGTLCATAQLDRALQKVAEQLADGMVQTVFRVGEQLQAQAQTAQVPTAPAAGGTGSGQATSFTMKATLLDENDNQILEGGEKIGVRVDATNQGAASTGSASVVLAGTPVVIDAFADILTTPIQVGPLQPGETKSLVFWGRMPTNAPAQRADLTVSVVSAEGGGHASQTLVAAVRPGKLSAHATAGQRSLQGNETGRATASVPPLDHHYAVMVGIDRYRGSSTTPSFGALDFNAVPELLSQSGGIPEDQILSLRNEQATRLDVEEALVTWLPGRIMPDSIVLFYFAGQAAADPVTGTVYLIPYDGTPSGSTRRLIALQDLQRALAALPGRLSVLLIDAAVTPLGNSASTSKTKAAKSPNWQGVLPGKWQTGQKSAGMRLIQIIHVDDPSGERGALLNWLQGGADRDGDGQITIGEVLQSLKKTAKVYPALPGSAPELGIPLSRSTPHASPSVAR